MSMPLHINGAKIWDGARAIQRDLFIKNGRIVAEKPNHALVVDLEGYTIFPGLINAHDHLELNHFPRTKFREIYDNAHQWGKDVNSRLNDEPFKTLRSYPIWDRLFIGGLKNLLCGATTVVHHGPKYREMYRKDFPVRVLKNYGWAHSLHFNTEEEIVRSYQSTPKGWPWFIHLAEGTDEVAVSEYQRLKNLGCVDENTVIVHGVGMTEEDIADAAGIVRGLVWCPSTNKYLLGETIPVRNWIRNGVDVALGNDSRLTAEGDFANEITEGLIRNSVDANIITESVSNRPAQIIRIDDAGCVLVNSKADFVVHSRPKRKLLKLVVSDGILQIGNPEIIAKFPHIQTVACTLDGVEKRMNIDLARQVHHCHLKEKGLEVDELPKGKRFIFF